MRIRGDNQLSLVEKELELLENEKMAMSQQKQVTWGDFATVPAIRHPLLIAVGVHVAQQFSGINAVILILKF